MALMSFHRIHAVPTACNLSIVDGDLMPPKPPQRQLLSHAPRLSRALIDERVHGEIDDEFTSLETHFHQVPVLRG